MLFAIDLKQLRFPEIVSRLFRLISYMLQRNASLQFLVKNEIMVLGFRT